MTPTWTSSSQLSLAAVLGAVLASAAGGGGEVWGRLFAGRTRRPPALVLDTNRLYRARPLLLTHAPPPDTPAPLYLLTFNATGVYGGEVEAGAGAVEAAVEAGGGGGGGLAYLALLRALRLIPYDSALLLVTPLQPSDAHLSRYVVDLIIAKRAKLFLVWTGLEEAGEVGRAAVRTGGDVVLVAASSAPAPPPPPPPLSRTAAAPPRQVTLARGMREAGGRPLGFTVDPAVAALVLVLRGLPQPRPPPPAAPAAHLVTPAGVRKEVRGVETRVAVEAGEAGEWELVTAPPPPGSSSRDYQYQYTVEALSHLYFTFTPSPQERGLLVVGVEGAGGGARLEEVELLEEGGRSLARLRPAAAAPNASSPLLLRLPEDLVRRTAYASLTGRTGGGGGGGRRSAFSRVAEAGGGWPPRGRRISSLELLPGSELSAPASRPATLLFRLTNNWPVPSSYDFLAHDTNNFIRSVRPDRAVLEPLESVVVSVVVVSSGGGSGGGEDLLTLEARQRSLLSPAAASLTASAYFRTSSAQRSDGSKPDISYSYSGDCSGRLSPRDCYASSWSALITVQDPDSGLLSVRTEPAGLVLRRELIAGSREPATGRFAASCCTTKLYVEASDVSGNIRGTTLDIETIWLSAGEVAAIVLGALLGLALLLALAFLVARACRSRCSAAHYYVN